MKVLKMLAMDVIDTNVLQLPKRLNDLIVYIYFFF